MFKSSDAHSWAATDVDLSEAGLFRFLSSRNFTIDSESFRKTKMPASLNETRNARSI